jgi:hypothetical protein
MRIIHVSPGAAKKGYTTDALASAPLSPLHDFLERISNVEKAVMVLAQYPDDDAGGSRNPRTGEDDPDGEVTEDARRRRRRMRDAGARSWSTAHGSGYEEVDDSAPDQDFTPAGEREKAMSKLDFQRRRNDGNNTRADGSASETDDADATIPGPPSPAEINAKNAAAWKRDTDSLAGNAAAEQMQVNTARPRQAGTISVEGRKSTTAATWDPGKTFGSAGTTSDSMRRGATIIDRWDAQSSEAIAAISDKWSARR